MHQHQLSHAEETYQRALANGDEVAVTISRIALLQGRGPVGKLRAILHREDMMTFIPGNWLNDEIITAVLGMKADNQPNVTLLRATVMAVNTYELPGIPGVYPFQIPYDDSLVIVPVNVFGNHWILVTAYKEGKVGNVVIHNSLSKFSAEYDTCKQ